jgi:hypothetical protein
MRSRRNRLILLAIGLGVIASARLSVRAQDRGEPIQLSPRPHADRPAASSVHDALERPFVFPFAAPTALADVCQHLRQALRAPVVLDLAALQRQELKPDDTVQLELEGVRLKTGLKLLLDQVGLTYQVVPEDNLLILTDRHGSSDPIDRILSEIKALHRDVHDLQDAIDEITQTLTAGDESGARMRKPTIIEEVPGEKETKPGEKAEPPPQDVNDRPRSRKGE